MFFEESIYMLVHQNLDGDCIKKEHSSAGNISIMFYLYSDKHFGSVNVCALLFRHLS